MPAVAPRLPAGTSLGDFVILRRVAAGGMGELYQAQQTSTRRVRALKVMHEHIAADPALRARFAREATVVASVASEHIVEVLAAGMEEDGVAWIAMEWLDGVDLATHLRDRRALSPAAVSALVAQLGHALGVAHAAGIVHRDLKPENIFLARTQRADGAVTLKLLDFGIARVLAEATVSRGTSTLGSPLWMAPEQYDPERAITAAADVWSLGLVVFRALTGKHYLRAAHAQRGPTPEAVMSEVLLADLPFASKRAAEISVERPLPDGFDRWFSRCVARDPDERFENGGVAARALVALLGPGDPSELAPAMPVSAPSAEPATRPEEKARDAPTVARANAGSATLDAATRDHTAIEERFPRGPDDRSPSATDTADRERTSTLGSSTAASVLSANGSAEAPRSSRTRVALAVSGAIAVLASVVTAAALVSRPAPVQLTGQRPWYSPWAAQVRARIHEIEPRLRGCVPGPSRGPMRVLASYRADGSFVRAYIGGVFSGTDEARCVEALLRSVGVPGTGGGDATVPFDFDLWGPAVGTTLAASSDDASSSTTLDASAEDAMNTARSRTVMIIAGAATLAAASANARASAPATSAPSTTINAQVDRLFVLPSSDLRSFSAAHAGALEIRMHPNGRWMLIVPRAQGSHPLTLVRRDGTTDALSVTVMSGPSAPVIPPEGVSLAGRDLRATHSLGACRVLPSSTGLQLRRVGAGSCHVIFDNGTGAPLVEDYTTGTVAASSSVAPPTGSPSAQSRLRFSQSRGLQSAIDATAPALRRCLRVATPDRVRVSALVAAGGRMSQILVEGAPTPQSTQCMVGVIEGVHVPPEAAGLRVSNFVSLASPPPRPIGDGVMDFVSGRP